MTSRSETRSAPPLIINGDDFGYSTGVNQAILEAHRSGVLTSASLMVNEAAVDDAVAIARAHPGLAVGLHLSLVLGRSALSHSQIPHLVDENRNFSPSPLRAGLNYFFGPRARVELRSEMRAQFQLFAGTGLRFSHVDGHNHLHMHPVVFKEIIALCEEFDVRRLRVVRGETRIHFQITGRRMAADLLMSTIFNLLSWHCSRLLKGRGFAVPRVVHGLLQSGGMTEDYLIKLLPRIGIEGAEIYLHPLSSAASQAERDENPGGPRELEALLSPEVRRLIEARGFRLASYETY